MQKRRDYSRFCLENVLILLREYLQPYSPKNWDSSRIRTLQCSKYLFVFTARFLRATTPKTTKKLNKQMTKQINDNPNLVSRAEFARVQGWNRSRVSQLAKDGRLVVDVDGNVFVAESIARINSTKDLSKISTIERHKANRQTKQNASVDAALIESIALNTADVVEGSFIDYKTKNEKYKALKAQAEYELTTNKLLLSDDVIKVVANAAGIIRARFEAQPEALAYQLAAISEPAQIAATLKEYNENLLNELYKMFKQLSK